MVNHIVFLKIFIVDESPVYGQIKKNRLNFNYNMKKLTKKTYITVLIFLAVILTFAISCSRSKPEISFGFMTLILYQAEPEPVERFSFFIIPEDEDGIENLDELYIYHDREQLRWKIKSDEWIRHSHEGKEWIGTRSLSVQEGSLPRGVFRAVLVNKGGESSERSFTFDGNVRYDFPEFTIIDGLYALKSDWPSNRLVCYDRSGNYIMTVNLPSRSGSISQLNLTQSVRTVALWAEDEVNFCSAFTNAVLIGR